MVRLLYFILFMNSLNQNSFLGKKRQFVELLKWSSTLIGKWYTHSNTKISSHSGWASRIVAEKWSSSSEQTF